VGVHEGRVRYAQVTALTEIKFDDRTFLETTAASLITSIYYEGILVAQYLTLMQ
jgi:hypothetical protein